MNVKPFFNSVDYMPRTRIPCLTVRPMSSSWFNQLHHLWRWGGRRMSSHPCILVLGPLPCICMTCTKQFIFIRSWNQYFLFSSTDPACRKEIGSTTWTLLQNSQMPCCRNDDFLLSRRTEGAKVGAPGSVKMRRKIAFSCLLQAKERNFLPHIHRAWSADFSPPL